MQLFIWIVIDTFLNQAIVLLMLSYCVGKVILWKNYLHINFQHYYSFYVLSIFFSARIWLNKTRLIIEFYRLLFRLCICLHHIHIAERVRFKFGVIIILPIDLRNGMCLERLCSLNIFVSRWRTNLGQPQRNGLIAKPLCVKCCEWIVYIC